ncbi:MAG: CaiB/BaiF CoA transferase family protein, partial [Burkholderiales bacterium]
MESAGVDRIRVLDMSRVLAGPLCGQLLADMGADVIKIERPGTGDDSRAWGPPFLTDLHGEPTAESAFYLSCNRGKRSVTVDLGTVAGRDVIRKLAASCDVLLENYKVGTLEKYGLGYADLTEINPRLVYCSITGFGQTGPYSSRPGYDTIIQAMGGLMSIT